jgi:hypothetical protein
MRLTNYRLEGVYASNEGDCAMGWKVGDWPEYRGGVYRIAAMDAFGFCLLRTREGGVAFIHADSREFTDHLITDVARSV